jgi:hypothetical protein
MQNSYGNYNTLAYGGFIFNDEYFRVIGLTILPVGRAGHGCPFIRVCDNEFVVKSLMPGQYYITSIDFKIGHIDLSSKPLYFEMKEDSVTRMGVYTCNATKQTMLSSGDFSIIYKGGTGDIKMLADIISKTTGKDFNEALVNWSNSIEAIRSLVRSAPQDPSTYSFSYP